MSDIDGKFAIVDWRDRIFDLYREIRAKHPTAPEGAHRLFREVRDELFKRHPASPLNDAQRQHFAALPYFEYRLDLNVEAKLIAVEGGRGFDVELGDDGVLPLIHFANARFTFDGSTHTLPVYWMGGYGGGIFIPFQDATNGESTYGGGRYLFDTRKGANLGVNDGMARLDFNFAYNPSCAYNERWVCPLARPESRFPFAVTAGEQYVDL